MKTAPELRRRKQSKRRRDSCVNGYGLMGSEQRMYNTRARICPKITDARTETDAPYFLEIVYAGQDTEMIFFTQKIPVFCPAFLVR